MGNFHFNAEDYVHVIQHMGETIEGIYDGVKYTFEDGVPSEPIHWRVAHHIFGYMGTEAARVNALHRLGWLTRMEERIAMAFLKTKIEFQPMNPFPKGVVEFTRPKLADALAEPTGAVTPTDGSTPAGAAGEAVPQPSTPADPFAGARGARPRSVKG